MRFLDVKKNSKLDKILICLTYDEAEELKNSLLEVLNDSNRHEHIQNEDFSKEITVCIYDLKNVNNFDERTKKLFLEDE